MDFEVLHSGFDKLEVSFNGALPAKLRAALEAAKQRAGSNVEPEHINLKGVDCWVKETGARGGYAYVFSTAEDREMWAIKDNEDPENWNLRCVVSSVALAVDGWHAVRDRLLLQLKAWGAKTTEISISRVDYAVDFIAPDFRLMPERLICHSHATVGGYPDQGEPDEMAVHWKNRQVTSLTVGKMPGRQVQIYDKAREVRSTGKGQWHEIWGRCPLKNETVWRIEVRAGKEHLGRAGIKSFDDVEEKIGSLFQIAMEKVRLAATSDFDNATRAATDPVWVRVREIVRDALEDSQGAVTFERIVEGRREEIADTYRKQIIGCALGYAVTLRKGFMETLEGIGVEIADDIAMLYDGDRCRLIEKYHRAVCRLKFLEPAANDTEDVPYAESGGPGRLLRMQT